MYRLAVLSSGGVDSSVMLALLTKDQVDCYPLFVDYGQAAREAERKAAGIIAASFKWKLRSVNLGGVASLSSSSLSTGNLHDSPFFPNRNLLLITVASTYASLLGLDGVAIGLINTPRYPDCTPEFIAAASSALRVSLGKEILVTAPLIKYDKRTVVSLGRRLSVPLSQTFSCLVRSDRHCGRCESCVDRKSCLG